MAPIMLQCWPDQAVGSKYLLPPRVSKVFNVPESGCLVLITAAVPAQRFEFSIFKALCKSILPVSARLYSRRYEAHIGRPTVCGSRLRWHGQSDRSA